MFTHLITTRLLTGASRAGNDGIYFLNTASLNTLARAPQASLGQGFTTANLIQLPASVDKILSLEYSLGTASTRYVATDLRTPLMLSANTQITDVIFFKLKDNNYTGTLKDMLFSYYEGTPNLTVHDAEKRWLISRIGPSTLSNQDMWTVYLRQLGYSGTLPDMIMRYWINF